MLGLWGMQASLSAQKSLNKVVQESCSCLEKANLRQATSLHLEHIADSCMRKAFVSNIAEIWAEQPLNLDDDRQAQQFGERLGRALYQQCSAYRQYWTGLASLQLEEERQTLPSIQGNIERVETSPMGDKLFIWVRSQNPTRLQQFWLGRAFVGATSLHRTDTLVGRTIFLRWDSVQIYNPHTQDFDKLLEIRQLDILENTAAVPRTRQQIQLEKQRQRLMRKKRIRLAKAYLKAVKAS